MTTSLGLCDRPRSKIARRGAPISGRLDKPDGGPFAFRSMGRFAASMGPFRLASMPRGVVATTPAGHGCPAARPHGRRAKRAPLASDRSRGPFALAADQRAVVGAGLGP